MQRGREKGGFELRCPNQVDPKQMVDCRHARWFKVQGSRLYDYRRLVVAN